MVAYRETIRKERLSKKVNSLRQTGGKGKYRSRVSIKLEPLPED